MRTHVDAAAQAFYLAKLGALALAVLLALGALVLQLRRRRPSATGRIIASVLIVTAVGVLVVRDVVRPSVLWLVALLVIGVVLGILVGRGVRAYEDGGRVAVKRSPIPPLVGALAYIIVAIALLFGTTYLLALALLLLVFSAGMSAGSAFAESQVARGLTLRAAEPAPTS